jgi:microcystin-dependent protein
MASCRNCFDNCDKPISDKCIKSSIDVPLLDICKGDQLSLVQSIIVEKLLSALDGTGITPEEVSIQNNETLQNLLKYKDPTLNNLLQILIDNQQNLTQAIESLGGTDITVFDIKCLTGLPEEPSRDEILQKVLTLLCTVKSTVDLIPTTYVKNSDLKVLVDNIIAGNADDDEDAVAGQHYLKAIPYVAYPYFGSLSNFDNTGKGLSTQKFDKIYLCNGLNGTPDMRGRTPVGAVRNVPGTTLDPSVDPLSPSNPNSNYELGQKFGKGTHTLVTTEIPSHGHVVSDPGHTHNIASNINDVGISSQPNGLYDGTDNNAVPKTLVTKPAFTNISIQATGGGGAHNNVQPSIGSLFIMYIP